MLLYEGFIHQAKQQPDKVCLSFEGQNVTYSELHRRCNRLANALLALGLKKGEMVSVLLSNCVE